MASLDEHVRQVNRCNQRGGRMLSVRDLLDAGTLSESMAAYFLATISFGRSFLVGARPGGAGKTTVMAALLNFIPDLEIVPTESAKVIHDGLDDPEPKCFLAHEIGHGSWYAYIWGRDVADFLRLTRQHMVAANLHADDIDDVLGTPGIDQNNLTCVDLLVFMRMIRSLRGVKRRITEAYENRGGEGRAAFRLVYSWMEERDDFHEVERPTMVSERRIAWAEGVVEAMLDRGLRSIAEVRSLVVERLSEAPQ